MQTDITGERAIGGSHQNLLPIPCVAAATHLKVLAKPFKLGCSLQQAGTGIAHRWALLQPTAFLEGVILESSEAVKR